MFESLRDFVAAALGIMKPEPPARTVVELDDQGKLMESKAHPEMPVCLLVKKKGMVLSASPLRFHDGVRNNISILRSRRSLSMTLLQPNYPLCSLTNPARLLLLTVSEKQEDLMVINYATASISLS